MENISNPTSDAFEYDEDALLSSEPNDAPLDFDSLLNLEFNEDELSRYILPNEDEAPILQSFDSEQHEEDPLSSNASELDYLQYELPQIDPFELKEIKEEIGAFPTLMNEEDEQVVMQQPSSNRRSTRSNTAANKKRATPKRNVKNVPSSKKPRTNTVAASPSTLKQESAGSKSISSLPRSNVTAAAAPSAISIKSQPSSQFVVVKKEDEKYQKRLVANKKSAQASRERKKALKTELEEQVSYLTNENSSLATSITEMETENKVLKGEFINLLNIINDSAFLSKLMARANATLQNANERARMESLMRDAQNSVNAAVQNTDTQNNEKSQNSVNPSTAASMYLMIVMYSFSQYFKNMPAMNAALANQVPSLQVVS